MRSVGSRTRCFRRATSSPASSILKKRLALSASTAAGSSTAGYTYAESASDRATSTEGVTARMGRPGFKRASRRADEPVRVKTSRHLASRDRARFAAASTTASVSVSPCGGS